LQILNGSRQNYQKPPGEESLNAQALLDSLQKLADQAGPEKSLLIQNYMAASRAQTLALEGIPVAQADTSVNYQGRLGGVPLLPQDFPWPTDRSGAPMVFIGQFDLGRLPTTDVNYPQKGLLSIFRSPQILTMPAKDRRAFHILYIPDFAPTQLIASQPASLASQPSTIQIEALPEWSVLAAPAWSVSEELDDLKTSIGLTETTIGQLRHWAKEFNLVSCGTNRIFGSDLDGLCQQKEICAFAASGISHSAARAKDSHYSHLMDEVPHWMLLAKFDEAELFGNEIAGASQVVAETRILIRREDLTQGLFERAWMICRADN
jgi:hypothetical protein